MFAPLDALDVAADPAALALALEVIVELDAPPLPALFAAALARPADACAPTTGALRWPPAAVRSV